MAVPLSPTPPPVSPAQNRVALEPPPSLLVGLGGSYFFTCLPLFLNFS